MLPNLFPLLKDSSAVRALIGDVGGVLRFYRHGTAPQGVTAPYVTHQAISGTPELVLDGTPPVDGSLIQVSCWSDNAGTGSKGIETLGTAVRDAIEAEHHIVSFRDMGQDPETKRYRIDLDVSVWNPRS